MSTTGTVGPASWRVPTSRGSVLLEIEPALFGRKVTVRLGGREIARFPKPNGQRPWIEHVLPGDAHEVVLVLVWEPKATSSHVFVDGANLRGGETLDARRAQAPKPMDRYEQNIIHGWVMREDNAVTLWALLGGASITVLALRDQPLPVVIAAVVVGSVLALICVSVWLGAVKRFALWLLTKPTWNDGLRAEAVFLMALSPLAALLMVGWIATGH
jgi:hypothetical protein